MLTTRSDLGPWRRGWYGLLLLKDGNADHLLHLDPRRRGRYGRASPNDVFADHPRGVRRRRGRVVRLSVVERRLP